MAKTHVGGTHCSYNKITNGRTEDMAVHSMHAVHIHACVTLCCLYVSLSATVCQSGLNIYYNYTNIQFNSLQFND